MAYKKFVGTFQNETEVLNKIDELKTQGYSDNDIYIVRNDADVIGFLYRYNYYNKETDMPGLLEINIVKHPNCTRTVSVGPSDFLGNCRGGSESGGRFRITGCHRL